MARPTTKRERAYHRNGILDLFKNFRQRWKLIALAFVLSTNNVDVCRAEKQAESWEQQVKRGNQYRDRGRLTDARKYYFSAVKILEKQDIQDIRMALVLHDIAETYRTESKFHEARLNDVRCNSIYKREIAAHQLGYEYASKKPVKIEEGSLRPHCYLCHENWKVVPVRYGEGSGYEGEVPAESDLKFTHKPGGREYCDQRWYCRDCHQSF